MTHNGACPCGAVRFSIDGPVRDVIVCHCDTCREATGGPWAASAAHRSDLTVDQSTLIWERAAVSEHGASRGRCRQCSTVVFWDAPGRQTVSFAAGLLEAGVALEVAAHIWVPEGERDALEPKGVSVQPTGLPESTGLRWHPGPPPATS